MDLFNIYMLNLFITLAMFLVLIFRAWIEYKNFNIMWAEIKRRQDYDVIARILKAEKDLFCKVEGGEELHRLLCEIFHAKDFANK